MHVLGILERDEIEKITEGIFETMMTEDFSKAVLNSTPKSQEIQKILNQINSKNKRKVKRRITFRHIILKKDYRLKGKE